MTPNISFRSLFVGPRPRATAPLLFLMAGLLGWISAVGSALWLGSHDSGDPDQWVGGLWATGVLVGIGMALAASVLVVSNWKSARVRGLEWVAVVFGGSFLLVGLGVFGMVLF